MHVGCKQSNQERRRRKQMEPSLSTMRTRRCPSFQRLPLKHRAVRHSAINKNRWSDALLFVRPTSAHRRNVARRNTGTRSHQVGELGFHMPRLLSSEGKQEEQLNRETVSNSLLPDARGETICLRGADVWAPVPSQFGIYVCCLLSSAQSKVTCAANPCGQLQIKTKCLSALTRNRHKDKG